MIIREAKIEELDKVMDFYEMMCRELASKDFLPNGNKGGFPSLEMVTEAIKNSCLYVGEENGEIAAAYIMNNECDPAYDAVPWRVEADKKHAAILHALRVAPNYGGRGYAGRLVEHAAETARAKGRKAIRLDCLVENTIAHKLYLSHGFQIVGETEMYYEDIGERRKFLMFERVITD